MKKSVLFIFCIFSLLSTAFTEENQDGILFKFGHKADTATSHVATVKEEAYFNGQLNSKTEFINRMTTTVLEELEEGAAHLKTEYMITQNSLVNGYKNPLTWGEESSVEIIRKSNGQFYPTDAYSTTSDLPTIRGVPSFPNKPVKVGESWTMKGEEVHDCKELFQMDQFIRVPFTATYKYIGTCEVEGKTYHKIEVYYYFQQDNSNNRIYRQGYFAGIQGQAAQLIIWDAERNDLYHYEEQFEIEMFDHYSNSYYFTGVSNGDVTEYKSLNNDDDVQKIKDTVEEYELEDVSVSKGDKGLTISIENIQFEPDSDILRPSEKEKLRKLGEILKTVNNDLLITGHCADRGTRGAQQNLSESRASAVANFLIDEKVRDSYHIFTQGKGAREPVASNDTEAGRAKNRRVEITIMD